MDVQPAPFCPDPWPRFDPSERSRAFRAMADEPLFVAMARQPRPLLITAKRYDAAAVDQRSEPCRRETRPLPFLTRCENLSRHFFDRERRNPARGASVSELRPMLGVRSLALLRCSLLRSSLLRRGLAALLGVGFLHCHCCLLMARHTCLIPTGLIDRSLRQFIPNLSTFGRRSFQEMVFFFEDQIEFDDVSLMRSITAYNPTSFKSY
jgi:hypothetical protein